MVFGHLVGPGGVTWMGWVYLTRWVRREGTRETLLGHCRLPPRDGHDRPVGRVGKGRVEEFSPSSSLKTHLPRRDWDTEETDGVGGERKFYFEVS